VPYYIVIYGKSAYTTFFHIIMNMILEEKKKLLNIKCVYWISLHFLTKIFPVRRRTEGDIIINVYRSSCKMPFIFVRFWLILTFLDRFPKKNSNIRLRENPSSGSRVVPCGRTNVCTDLCILIMLFIVRLTQKYDVKLSYVQLIKLHVSNPWGSSSGLYNMNHTRYVWSSYLRDRVVYSALVIKYML